MRTISDITGQIIQFKKADEDRRAKPAYDAGEESTTHEEFCVLVEALFTCFLGSFGDNDVLSAMSYECMLDLVERYQAGATLAELHGVIKGFTLQLAA